MYKTCRQDNITSTNMQTFDEMETFELNIVNEN